MNVSQLLATSNRVRKELQANLLSKEPVINSSFHFDDFFKNLESSSRSMLGSLKQSDQGARPLAEKLAKAIDQDREKKMISQHHLFDDLENFGINTDFHGLELNESNAQEVLGSLFQTLDTLIQSQDDSRSNIGESDGQILLNLERLSDLIEQFDEMIESILVKVSDASFKTLETLIGVNASDRFYSNAEASFESSARKPVAEITKNELQTH